MYRHMWRSTKLLMRLNRVCVRWDAAMASMYPRPWEGLEMARPCIRWDRHCRSWGIADTKTGSRSEEHTSELQSLMRISYAVFCLKKKKKKNNKLDSMYGI